MTRVPVCVLGFLLLFLLAASADEIELTNGNVLEGEIVKETEAKIVIRTSIGDITVSRSTIKSIKRTRKPEPRPEPGSPGEAGGSPGGSPGEGGNVDDLMRTLEGGTPESRAAAARALGALGAKAGTAVPALIRLFLRDPVLEVKGAAIDALEQIREVSPPGSFPVADRIVLGGRHGVVEGFLERLAAGEEQFKNAVVLDSDRDGIGEYASLEELAGRKAIRGGGFKPDTPYVQSKQLQFDDRGRGLLAGYCIVLYLPGRDGSVPGSEARAGEGADGQERAYVCYAVPVKPGWSGVNVYAVSTEGRVMFIQNGDQAWSADAPPPPGLAFAEGRDPAIGAARFVRSGEKGGASEAWRQIGQEEEATVEGEMTAAQWKHPSQYALYKVLLALFREDVAGIEAFLDAPACFERSRARRPAGREEIEAWLRELARDAAELRGDRSPAAAARAVTEDLQFRAMPELSRAFRNDTLVCALTLEKRGWVVVHLDLAALRR